MGAQPFANALLADPENAERRYPLELSWCENCRLVQLNHTADPKELFSNYVWVTGTSSTAQTHANMFCEETLLRAQSFDNGSYVLELASNDGTFLKPFMAKGVKVLGVDPAENVVQMARREGVRTHCGFFGDDLANELLKEHGPARVVIARNVLPHVANLSDFVRGMRSVMADDGLAVIEAHYGAIIQRQLHYDSIYHEHLCYFTLESISTLLHNHDLEIFDISKSPISGGSLIIFARKAGRQASMAVERLLTHEAEAGVNELGSWENFSADSQAHKKLTMNILENQLDSGARIIGYGASARSSTLLNFCGIGAQHLSVIADQNLMKQKLYTAGSHIPISSPEEVMKTNPDTVFILAWNFLQEIKGILSDRFGFGGRLIVPFPGNPSVISGKGK
ncbi:MAG TPA: class I SAM-dependent methyltransferase [Nitrospirae bacterium]|nr:class I SAM-dependent methyltransferase [Nitrospirota bacterium]